MRGLWVVIALAACGSSRPGAVDAPAGGGDSNGSNGADASQTGDIGTLNIFAHSGTTLYRVDPDTLAITMVGNFNFSLPLEQMNDIAIDKAGQMTGVSSYAVYRIDTTSAQLTQLATSFSNMLNGLSYVPADQVGMTGDDVLIGTRISDGKVFHVDPSNGSVMQIGDMGAFVSSGDLVAVAGFGTMQTVKGSTHDRLARLAPNTFAATPIGTDTGFDDIWGVAFWKGTIYGFTDGGQFISIDPNTGAGHLIAGSGPAWFGAAVTTVAPIIL